MQYKYILNIYFEPETQLVQTNNHKIHLHGLEWYGIVNKLTVNVGHEGFWN